jgi:hypothetical protein
VSSLTLSPAMRVTSSHGSLRSGRETRGDTRLTGLFPPPVRGRVRVGFVWSLQHALWWESRVTSGCVLPTPTQPPSFRGRGLAQGDAFSCPRLGWTPKPGSTSPVVKGRVGVSATRPRNMGVHDARRLAHSSPHRSRRAGACRSLTQALPLRGRAKGAPSGPQVAGHDPGISPAIEVVA